MMQRLTGFLLALALAAGCAQTDGNDSTNSTGSSDALDDCFTCGWDRADSFTVTAYQEVGVLDLVNRASRRELDEDVALDVRAANNIVDERAASGAFETLTRLDEVAYVGPAAFERLVNYATDHGYVGACGDGALQGSLETCDDGNGASGDGCSDRCQLENGSTVHGIAEGSPEADAVLRVVNTASQRELDDRVRLDRRAAGNIVNMRPFSTLLQLDEVPYVAETAFDQLLRYARANAMFCASGAVDELIADINSTRWNTYFTREIRTDVSLEHAIDSRNWPSDPTHAGCFGVEVEDLPHWIPVTEAENNTRVMRLFQAFASAARRMGTPTNLDSALDELTCRTDGMEFAGCRLVFEPNPGSGITWNIIESIDGSVRYLFVGTWTE